MATKFLTYVLIPIASFVSLTPAVNAQVPDPVRGIDIASAMNLLKDDVKAEVRLFIPDKVARVQAIVVVTAWGLGNEYYADPELRKLIEEGLALMQIRLTNIRTDGIDNRPIYTTAAFDALSAALGRLAIESKHPELDKAPLLLWGHSRAGNLGAAFALAYPERTVALVFYQSAAALVIGPESDLTPLRRIPVLILDGIVDPKFDPDVSVNLLKRGRSMHAPWAHVFQPAPHGSPEFLKAANRLLIPWMRAVVSARVAPDGSLRGVSDDTGWVGDHETREIMLSAPSPTSQSLMSWLPDETSARAWRELARADARNPQH